jgi:hypothetical protein
LTKFKYRSILIISVFLFALTLASQAKAQGVDVYFGMGTASDGAASDPSCPAPKQIVNLENNCVGAPVIDGTFGVIGGDVMIKSHLGVNVEDSFRFAQASYVPTDFLNARQSFYDFNAVYQPLARDSKIAPVIEGGIGGTKISIYYNQSLCSLCGSQNSLVLSSNHFQVHGAVGLKMYLRSNIFIKPQVDLHYVPHLNQEYGSNFVPQYTVSIGYSFGR